MEKFEVIKTYKIMLESVSIPEVSLFFPYLS